MIRFLSLYRYKNDHDGKITTKIEDLKEYLTIDEKVKCDKIKIDEEASKQICIDSNGCMRDAIGLLDQLNSYTNIFLYNYSRYLF